MSKLRFGVIGAGAFAAACHVPGLQSHPQAEVVAICGRRREAAQALASRFGVSTVYDDPAELCARDDLDGISICTPNAAHREQALLAFGDSFGRGKHVFCEKPLGLSVAEAEEMTLAAEASGRVHQVAFTYRYLYGVEELRRRVAAGDVGEPFLFRAHHEYWDGLRASGWRPLKGPSGGGVLYDLGSHFFDLARFLLGPIEAVKADLQLLPRPGVETDDIATANIRFASGARGQWQSSRITPPRAQNHVQVVGREGALEALLSRGSVDALRLARPGKPGWEDLPLPEEARDGQAHSLGRMMRSFVDACLRGGIGEGDASFGDGLAVQRALTAAEESAAGGWVGIG
ncbi:MAG TPA: Gfo/Idh/MocA family oxidoreductase [Thermoanaerobaculia bacterium]|jgi:predicted dehydrogenase|nr:Gfo/Idh/MocA family oxidoreductase [Thermoanaerobaculia bacterium]